MLQYWLFAQCWLLLLVANGAPVIVARMLGKRADRPVDGGRLLADGEPLFGSHKNRRGLAAGIGATTLLAGMLGLGASNGALIGTLAMTGDLAASFFKRRRKLAPGARSTVLDQLPESLLPMSAAPLLLGVSWPAAVAAALLFVVSNILISTLLFRLGISRQPF